MLQGCYQHINIKVVVEMLNKYWNDAVMHLNISQTLQGSCTCTRNEKIRDLSISGREKQPATTRCNAACR